MAHAAAATGTLLHHPVLRCTYTTRRRCACACASASASPRAGLCLHRRRSSRRTTILSTVRAMAQTSAAAAAPPGLKEGIVGLYDESSGAWESIWGDHMHHGFYDAGEAASMSDHRRAQIRMIEEALAFAAVPDDAEKKPKSVVDVGCGIGGSSRYLAKKYGAQCYGITLSPVQAERGNALATEQGLSDKVSFQVLMHWSSLFLMGSLILSGPWRVASTCQTNGRVEDYKRCNRDATDDPRIQERPDQIHHHLLS